MATNFSKTVQKMLTSFKDQLESVNKIESVLDKGVLTEIKLTKKEITGLTKSLKLTEKQAAATARSLHLGPLLNQYKELIRNTERLNRSIGSLDLTSKKTFQGVSKALDNIDDTIESIIIGNKNLSINGVKSLKEYIKEMSLAEETASSLTQLITNAENATANFGNMSQKASKKAADSLIKLKKEFTEIRDVIAAEASATDLLGATQSAAAIAAKQNFDAIKNGATEGLVDVEKLASAFETLSVLDKLQEDLEDTNDRFTAALGSGHISEAKALAIEVKKLQKATLLVSNSMDEAGRATLTYDNALKLAEKDTNKLSVASKFMKDKLFTNITTATLATATYINFTKKVRESTDLWIKSGRALSDELGQGFTDVISRSLDLSAAMTKVDFVAIKLGEDVHKVRDDFRYLSEQLRETDVDRLAGLTETVTTLSKIMGIETTAVIDAMKVKMLKMGQTAAEVTDDFTSIYNRITDINDAAGENVVRIDDITSIMAEAAAASDTYAQNTKLMTNVVMQSTIALQRHGLAYEASLDSAKEFIQVIQKAPDWMKWRAGRQIYADLMDPKKLAAIKKEYPHLRDQIDLLIQQGPGGQRVLAELLSETEVGIKAMIKETSRLNKVGGAFLLHKQLGMTETKAASLSLLLHDIDDAGGLDNFSKGLTTSYDKAVNVAKALGPSGLASTLNITKKEAAELNKELLKGPQEGEKALQKYQNEATAVEIAANKALTNASAAARGVGSATEDLVMKAQKSLRAAAALSGNVLKNAKALLEDNPIIMGVGAAALGLKGLIAGRAVKTTDPNTLAITTKLEDIRRAIMMGNVMQSGATSSLKKLSFMKNIFGKQSKLLTSLSTQFPKISKLLPRAGAGVGASAGLGVTAAAIGGGALLGTLASKLVGAIGEKETKQTTKRRTIGGGIGTGIGMFAGTILGGPVGTAIGGAAGGAVGAAVGKWAPYIKNTFIDIAHSTSAHWAGVMAVTKKLAGGVWSAVKNKAVEVWESTKDVATRAFDVVKNIGGKVVKGVVTRFNSIVDSFSGITDRVSSIIDILGDNFDNFYTKLKNIISGVQKYIDDIFIAFSQTGVGKFIGGLSKVYQEAKDAKEAELNASAGLTLAEQKARQDAIDAAKKKKEQGQKKPRGISGIRPRTSYRRYTTGSRRKREYEIGGALSATSLMPPTQPITYPISEPGTPPALYAPLPAKPMQMVVPQVQTSSGAPVSSGGAGRKPTVLAKAVGMSGNKAILEILNLDILITSISKNMTQSTL